MQVSRLKVPISDYDPRISQPPNITLSMKEHQSASCFRMRHLEENQKFMMKKETPEWSTHQCGLFDSNGNDAEACKITCGILANPVGSGKSLTILGTIADNPVLDFKPDASGTYYIVTEIGNLGGPSLRTETLLYTFMKDHAEKEKPKN